MSTILFVSYEIHPTTWGGAGVLLHHAAVQLLSEGHRVLFLLDVPRPYFERFDGEHRLDLPHPERCAAYHVDALVGDLPIDEGEVGNPFLWKSLRFDHALDRVLAREAVDFVEYFEYCGVAHSALVAKRFARRHQESVVGVRVHNSVEWIDAHESTKPLDRDRYLLYGLERAALRAAEAVLFPSRRYAEAYYLERYGIPESSVVISQSPKQPFGLRPERSPRDEVVYLGRVFEFKGVETFVRAALLLCERAEPSGDPPLRFVLIGSDSKDAIDGGSYAEHLLRSIPERHRSRFELTGHLDHEAVRERLGHALFGVLPNRFESFCYAAHELYDAGVPLVANDIPAFREFFEDEKNALIFDGSADGLAAAMERMAGDASLRERLSRPYPIATQPLGPFYDEPHAGTPIGTASDTPAVLTVVVSGAGASPQDERATLAALQKAATLPDRILVAREVRDDDGSAAAGSVRWLGRLVTFTDAGGRPLDTESLRSRDAIWLLAAGDRPGPDCLALARGALSRNEDLGFAGTWSRDCDGRLDASTLDLAPELHPFDRGSRLTRTLIRTPPDRLLFDLFDPRAGSYGETALLWGAFEQYGAGAMLAEEHLVCSATESPEHRPEHLAFLVTTVAGERLRERLALLTASLPASPAPAAPAPPASAWSPGFREVLAAADEHLNGRWLLRLAWRKLLAKLGLRGS